MRSSFLPSLLCSVARCDPTILVQETPSMKNVDPSCSTTSLFGDATCLPVGPLSLDWPVNPCGSSDPSGPSLPPGAPSGAPQQGAFSVIGYSRWRQGALQAQPQISQRTARWDGCHPFLSEGLRCITWNTRGLVGSVFTRQRNRESKLNYFKKTFGPQQHHLSPGSAWKGTSFFKLSR